ncbi:hypothetical protein HMPREF0530_1817 [Lacticaseibacillus paracasei subsp. paracasei ATCC 25302 = DSM 5622 = JCM 8130]|uniref:Uncharacterized protein n=1 Tax=Lacticaseibacillus paracasei N1115 TaxID=1446494 RepID=A0A806LKP6_LACPA|nr:hypothetical protein AF91_00210 [Lacticaseibacillus paracasei N1115]EEI67847.1 hypothetical protein HMPREF0530_1817 [Lacticaseibacillus paracasei subsp. paracasei ATCC 25302 = DSM 5622 = JCM 8130]
MQKTKIISTTLTFYIIIMMVYRGDQAKGAKQDKDGSEPIKL